MKLIIEALFVGLYTTFIYIIINFIQIHNHKNFLLINLFCVGFLKHWFGYYIGIQTYYCNIVNNKHNAHLIATPEHLFLISLIEGVIFVLLFNIFHLFIKTIWISIFFTGVSLHSLAEVTGVHKFFILNMCK